MSQEEGLKQELKGLEELKISLSASKLNQMKYAVELAITGFETKINEISQKLDEYEEINSCWKTDPIESDIEHLCSLSNVTNIESIYQSKSVPKWSILIGDKPSQLSSPTSLAIQQDTDNVFVSDKEGGRIQVYSSLGEHIRLIEKFGNPLNVFHVDGAFIVGISVQNAQYAYPQNVGYTQNMQVFMELNLESLVSRTLKSDIYVYSTFVASYIDSNSYVFFFASGTDYNIHKFIDTKPITNPPIKNQPIYPINICGSLIYPGTIFTPVSIATDGIHTYLLISNSANLIYEFRSEDCEFIRSFCSSSLLSSPKCVCVDSRGNILVAGSEGDSTKLLCLSPDGDVIHELLLPYEKCIGIAVNSKFDVAILCNGSTHGLISI